MGNNAKASSWKDFVVSVKAKWFAVAAIVMVSALCLWQGARRYTRYKEQRLAVQARLFLQHGRYKEAFLTTQQILGANPANVDGCRFMAEQTERAKDPSTLIWRRRVAELSPALENRLALAAAALLFERPPCPLASQTLAGIQARHEETVAYHLIAAQLALKLNRLEDAEMHYQKAIILEPGKESHQLNLAVLRLQSKEPSVVATARATLERLATNPRLRIFALRSLVSASLEVKDVEKARQFSEQLLTLPQCAFGDRVQHLTLLYSLRSPTFDAFLSNARSEASTNELQVYQLSGWLISRGLAEQALAWIEALAPVVKAKQPVPKAIVECLLAKKDWAKLELFLNEQQWGGQEFVRHALLALALRNQDRREAAELRLQGAARLASKHAETLAVLRQMLESWGWQSEADDMLRLLAKEFPNERWVSQALCLAYYSKGNTAGLYETYSRMLKSVPPDAPTKNNFAMICLLLNTNLDQARAMAEEAYRTEPRNAAFVSTRAFSLHTQGKHSEALALFQTLPSADLETPGIALYYGLALVAAGEVAQAQKFLSLAGHAQLLPEERRLLEETKRPQK